MFLKKIAQRIEGQLKLPKGVKLDAHPSGDILWIDWFYLPPEMRRQGKAEKIYFDFEASIPKKFKIIRLFAANSEGEKRSHHFWEKVGFDYTYEGSEELEGSDGEWMMWKGINGHATPKSIKLS